MCDSKSAGGQRGGACVVRVRPLLHGNVRTGCHDYDALIELRTGILRDAESATESRSGPEVPVL